MKDEIISFDPYALPPEAIREPPKTTWEALKKIGPGIILAGTIVGSGELILTTGLGAKFGFIFLWLVLFSCVIKVFIQVELGRYAISSGKPTLGALNELPGRGKGVHWLCWWWFIMMICTTMQLGGMTAAIGQVFTLTTPGLNDTILAVAGEQATTVQSLFSHRPEIVWATLTCLATILLIYGSGYQRLESLTTVIVVSVTTITIVAVLALNWTDFPIRLADVTQGLIPQVPLDQQAGLLTAFAVFGITGVGATELFYYPYWCLEKGYARYVGRNDGSPEWEARAAGWIKVMQLDAWVSMVVFTISTVAFYMLGAAVLHPQGLDPKGPALVDTLSRMYVGPFGEWTRLLFLIGAAVVLFKTLYLGSAANSRLAADFLILGGYANGETAERRAALIRKFCLIFPIMALLCYLFLQDPQLMVKIGGLAQASTLPMIAAATLYFRYKKMNPAIKPGWFIDAAVWVAAIAIFIVGCFAVPRQFMELGQFLLGLFK